MIAKNAKWTDILTKEELKELAMMRPVDLSRISPVWGGYGITKGTVEDVVSRSVNFTKRVLANHPGVPLHFSVYDGRIIAWVDPDHGRIMEWSEKYTEPCRYLGPIAADRFLHEADLSSVGFGEFETVADFGRFLVETIGSVPDALAEMEDEFLNEVGLRTWQEVALKSGFSGKSIGLTFQDGEPHSSSEDEYVQCSNGRAYFCLGKHFMTVDDDGKRKWECKSSTSRKWESILAHAKNELVRDVHAA